MAQKPSIAKGTRDFTPEEVTKRNYIIDSIKKHFETFGFMPIETPSFENSDTLMGKYGDEGDRLIFKILNSGRYFHEKVLETFKKEEDELRKKIQLVYNTCKEYGKENQITELPIETQKIIKSHKNINEVVEFFLTGSRQEEDLKTLKSQLDEILITKLTYDLSSSLTPKISEKALRYDLTVPFARYVVMHQNEIDLPFKRYQIQPVWRADRPQKGRFREFYQCDADVVGSTSLWQEVEFVQLYDAAFSSLGLKGVTIKINNRKILSGIAEVIGAKDKLIDFTVALDKLDKIGEEGVKKEMQEKGITAKAIEKVQPLFAFEGTNVEKIQSLKHLLSTSEEGTKGVEELEFILNAIESLGLKTANLDIDVTLARGLNYYTGAIFEVGAPDGVKMGSIGGGGRYDDLTGIFGLKDVSGVGISFGLDRIYLVLEELNLFPESVTENTKVLFLNFGEKEALYCLKAVKLLREKGVKAELYPDDAKMKKQMNYANKRNIPFVVLAGSKEMEAGTFTVKDMISGNQETIPYTDFESSMVN